MKTIAYNNTATLLGVLGHWPDHSRESEDYVLSTENIKQKFQGLFEDPEKFLNGHGVNFSEIDIDDRSEIISVLNEVGFCNGSPKELGKALQKCLKLKNNLLAKI